MFTQEIIDFLKQRVGHLTKIIEQSVHNHHSIIGRLQEAQELVKLAEQVTDKVASVIEEAIPVATPIIEEVANDVESILV